MTKDNCYCEGFLFWIFMQRIQGLRILAVEFQTFSFCDT